MSDNNIDVKISASTNGLASGIGEAKDEINSLADGAKGIIESFQGIGVALVAAFAFDKIDELARSMSELGEQVERTSKMTGLSVDDVQKFQFAVKLTGGDAETAGMSLMRLERNMADAAAGSKTAQASFIAAGVSLKTLQSGNVNEVLAQMADKFSQTADGANKTALAMELAGRGGASLIALLDLGRVGFKEYNAELAKTNSELTEAQVKGFAATAVQIKIMDAATQGVSEQIMTRLNPGIDGAVAGLTAMKEEFSENIKEGGTFATIISATGTAIEDTVKFIMYATTGFKEMWDVGLGALQALKEEWIGFGLTVLDVTSGNLTKAWDDFNKAQAKALDDFTAGINTALDETQKLEQAIIKMDAAAKKGIIPSGGAPPGKDKRPPPKLPDQSGSDPKSDDSEYRSLYQKKYDAKKESDDQMVASGKLSYDQEIADLQRALDVQEDLTNESFDKDIAAYQVGSDAYNKLILQKEIADQEFATKHDQLTTEQTKKDDAAWNEMSNTINSTFDKMLTGVLQGTQTIQQAFLRLTGDMIISFAEAIAKMLVQWAAFEVGINGAKNPFASVAGASGSGGGAASQLVTEMLSLVGVTTTQTGSTIALTASIEELIATMQLQQAGVQPGGLGSIFGGIFATSVGFAVGTPNVPEDMFAQIHKGEAIVPANTAQAWRDGDLGIGGGSGGGDTHFHVSAMDAKGVQQFFNQHGALIAKTVRNQVRRGSRSFTSHA